MSTRRRGGGAPHRSLGSVKWIPLSPLYFFGDSPLCRSRRFFVACLEVLGGERSTLSGRAADSTTRTSQLFKLSPSAAAAVTAARCTFDPSRTPHGLGRPVVGGARLLKLPAVRHLSPRRCRTYDAYSWTKQKSG